MEGRARPGIEVTRAAAAPAIDRGGVRIRILSPVEAVGENEVYELDFAAGARLVSEPHRPGCREHLTVIAGQIRLVSGEEAEALGPGDEARYPADRPHEIAAEGGPARAILIVQGR